jgi:signal transduction histidine kinase/ActR/RegA family two-component response regulator
MSRGMRTGLPRAPKAPSSGSQDRPMRRWSRQHTLNTGLIIIGLLAILSSGASLFASRVLIHDMAKLTAEQNRDPSALHAVRLAGLREISAVSLALFTGEAQHARVAGALSQNLRDQVARLRTQATDPEIGAFLESVERADLEYEQAFEDALRAFPGHPSASATALVGSRGLALEQSLDALVARIEPPGTVAHGVTREWVKRTQAVFNAITAVSIAVAVILCLILIVVINRNYRDQASARVRAEEGRTRITADLNEAKAANQLKDQFLATVSHELRNPLAPMLTWTQLLRSGNLTKEKADRGLEVIERNVGSLSQLIDDLVDVSRVVSGKFRLDVRPIDLVPVIRAAVESQRPASDARQIRLQLVLDERAGTISGDSERLQQVMSNLLSNAIKFTPKGGSVQVRLGRAESHVEIMVSDSGIGIEPGFLPHVFEPFQQEGDGSMRRHSGLGLGLSIVRHILELHGGEIVAASQGRGMGSTFTIKLPLLGTTDGSGVLHPRHPRVAERLANILLGRLDRVRVLLVDDEPTANEATQTLLDSCGAEVRVASSAAQALLMLDVWKPDVLISDIAMPEEDGYVLIKKIRARSAEQSGDLPAAALTAYATTEDRVSILAAGFQMYLSKPADPGELIAVVASLATRRRRASAENGGS